MVQASSLLSAQHTQLLLALGGGHEGERTSSSCERFNALGREGGKQFMWSRHACETCMH